MSCYSPLHAFKAKSRDSSKIAIVFRRGDSWKGERLDLPCGQCIGCRLERSRQWAVRCMHEASLHDENSFLTLTYDDNNLPVGGSLNKSHFQDFMKRLRKSIEPKRVRYYHCGEYGENFGRPHYHALLFGYRPGDLKYFSKKGENVCYTSQELSRVWPFGFSVVGDVTFESAAYVARYVMKKVTGPKAEVHYGGRLPEYTTMSRGSKKLGTGGIGKGWFDKFKSDVYPRDGVVVRGHTSRPPRFYDNLLGREDPSTLALMKIKRELNGQRYVTDVLSDGTEIRVSEQDGRRLMVKEEVKKAEITTLMRPLEGVI